MEHGISFITGSNTNTLTNTNMDLLIIGKVHLLTIGDKFYIQSVVRSFCSGL